MFTEELTAIREAEEQSEAIRKNVKTEVKRMIEAARAEAEKILDDEEIKAKVRPTLPARVENVIKCKNPRCVTSSERGLKNIFVLNDEENREYRCVYCDEIVSMDKE